jgi:hypothetical protein
MADETVMVEAPVTVRLFELRCPLITLALMSAFPVMVIVFPVRLQLVPEVPVCPVPVMVKVCENRLVERKKVRNTREFLARKEGFFTTSKLKIQTAIIEVIGACLGRVFYVICFVKNTYT